MLLFIHAIDDNGQQIWWKDTNQPFRFITMRKVMGLLGLHDGWMARQKLCNSYNILFFLKRGTSQKDLFISHLISFAL
jgi:hypothetical protein